MQEKLIKKRELARQLNVHPATLERWAQNPANNLKAVKVGRLIYFDVSNFDPGKVVAAKAVSIGQ